MSDNALRVRIGFRVRHRRRSPQYAEAPDSRSAASRTSERKRTLTRRRADSALRRSGHAPMVTRRLLSILTVTVVLATSLPAAATQPDFRFDGSGWGHGIGLSQYGAKGMAAGGSTAEEIIAHYFSGTTIRPIEDVVNASSYVLTDPSPVWVNLLKLTESVVFSATVTNADLCYDDAGTCPLSAAPGDVWRFTRVLATTCEYQKWDGIQWSTGSASGPCNGSVRPAGGGFYLDARAREYRHGPLRIRQAPETGKLHAVQEIGLENYLRGVSEMADSWPTEALRAQALASRSLAVQSLITRGSPDTFTVARQELCQCNLFSDSSDQVYGGHTAEASRPNWLQAVASTTGDLVQFGGNVALTVFSSSSGGTTERNSDYWGSAQVPYLDNVDDSAAYTAAAANPFATWVATAAQTRLATALGVDFVYDAVVSTRHRSGSVNSITFKVINAGRPTSVITSGRWVTENLGLRSQWFGVTTLPRFADVPRGHPFAGEILGLSELGITQGCDPEGTLFCPEDSVTRGEMAALLVRALDLSGNTAGNTFSDDNGHTFEDQIEILAANAVTKGCGIARFCPDDPVRRGEVAAFLVRALGLTANPGGDPFTDDAGIFENDIEILAAAGITNGCNPERTRFCPNAPVTRGEMAAFLIRSLALP